MKIWAHRGCSQRYPENTLTAFRKAAALPGLEGIELDVQLTKDRQMVICHDERVDRTTDGTGFVKDFTLEELQQLHIDAGQEQEHIPTIDEVFDLLEPAMRTGLRMNIEFKNSVFRYEGMEQMVIGFVRDRELEQQIVYSSFYTKSLALVHELAPKAEIGILDTYASDCWYKRAGGCGGTALHPYWQNIDLLPNELGLYPVRAWFGGHLYPEKPTGTKLNFTILEQKGITDVFLNEPEFYF